MIPLGRELRDALTAHPRGLGRALIRELAWFVPGVVTLAWVGGLLSPTPLPPAGELARLAAVLFVAPAFLEELLFRALPIRRDAPTRAQVLFSTLLFVLWHPLQVVTVGPPWADAFLRPAFLGAVAMLGLASARLYAATGSLWPSVLLHWLTVLIWKAALGGPF